MPCSKRLDDALRDGDEVLAVVESFKSNNDGGGRYILAPSLEGELEVLEGAYKNIDKNVDYIECHATGTDVGDSIELNSLEKFYADSAHINLFWSLEPNIGHTLTTSAIAAVMKVVLSMKNDIIPATINVKNPISSDKGDFSKENMVLKNKKWPKKGLVKRAGISSFGFGGNNSHLVISEYNEAVHKSDPSKPEQVLEPVSVVGIGSRFGDRSTNDQLVSTKIDDIKKIPSARWAGLDKDGKLLKDLGLDKNDLPTGRFTSEICMDHMKYGCSLKNDNAPAFRDMLMSEVATKAYKDSGLESKNVAMVASDVDEMAFHYLNKLTS